MTQYLGLKGTNGQIIGDVTDSNPLPTKTIVSLPTGTNSIGGVTIKSTGGIDANVASDALAGDANPTGTASLYVVNFMQAFNASTSTWDRWRNNISGQLLASAARTATVGSANQLNFNAKGVIVYLNVTASSGTGGLTLTIQAQDPVTTSMFNLNAPPTAVTANGEYIYELYPGIGAASGAVTQRTSGSLPRAWRVLVTHGDASSYTYSVGYSIIL